MVTVRQVDNPIDSTFKAGFIGDCDVTVLVGENVAIFFLQKRRVRLLALKNSKTDEKVFALLYLLFRCLWKATTRSIVFFLKLLN